MAVCEIVVVIVLLYCCYLFCFWYWSSYFYCLDDGASLRQKILGSPKEHEQLGEEPPEDVAAEHVQVVEDVEIEEDVMDEVEDEAEDVEDIDELDEVEEVDDEEDVDDADAFYGEEEEEESSGGVQGYYPPQPSSSMSYLSRGHSSLPHGAYSSLPHGANPSLPPASNSYVERMQHKLFNKQHIPGRCLFTIVFIFLFVTFNYLFGSILILFYKYIII